MQSRYKTILIAVLVFLGIVSQHAELKSQSYVLLQKKNSNKHYFVLNDSKVKIITNEGHTLKGRLNIINDSTISVAVYNHFSHEIKIKDINYFIYKRKMPVKFFIGTVLAGTAIMFTFGMLMYRDFLLLTFEEFMMIETPIIIIGVVSGFLIFTKNWIDVKNKYDLIIK